MVSINCLPNSCSIATLTETNVNGGRVKTYTVTSSNLPCLIVDTGTGVRTIYGQRKVMITHQIYISPAYPAPFPTTGDAVIVGSRNFFIQGAVNPGGQSNDAENLIVLYCTEDVTNEIIIEA
jgi:hypothetical protein